MLCYLNQMLLKMYLWILNTFTDDKKYLMGDQPVEVDCAAYGQLVQMLNTPDSIPGKLFMKGK